LHFHVLDEDVRERANEAIVIGFAAYGNAQVAGADKPLERVAISHEDAMLACEPVCRRRTWAYGLYKDEICVRRE
jgi:hypothetical protein